MIRKTQLANHANYGGYRSASQIKYIILHFTANDGDNDEGNGSYFNRSVVKASAHYFVDDDSATQSVPDNRVAWAVGGNKWNDCGKTGGGKMYGKITNTNSVSIEMCDTRKDGVVQATEATMANAAALCRGLMAKYNIPISNVYRHFDVTGKHCPAYFMDGVAWAAFRARLTEREGINMTDREKVQKRFGFSDKTMDFLEAYKYSADLLKKLAEGK